MRVARTLFVVLVYLTIAVSGRSFDLPGDAREAGPASQAASEYDNLEAVLDTASGPIVIEFFPKDAPRHVESFVKNARDGAYDGTTFHRVVKNALIQGGDPLS